MRLCWSVAILLLPALVGCGQKTVVTGKVTYEGNPIAKGSISFLPADGKGPAAGGEIEEGRYQVEKITPGKKLVQIVGVKPVKFARSSEEMAKMAAEAGKKGDPSGIIDRADAVPADAVGNNAPVEIQSGPQTLDFDLKKKT